MSLNLDVFGSDDKNLNSQELFAMKNKHHSLQKTKELKFSSVTYAKMSVNCSASLFKVIHANFLTVCYPTHFKPLSYIYFRNKATPITLTMKTLKTVSQVYTHFVS